MKKTINKPYQQIHQTIIFLSLLFCFTLPAKALTLADVAAAQPAIEIVSPNNGEAIYAYSTQYNNNNETLTIEGSVSNLIVDYYNLGDLDVVVNGQSAGVLLLPNTFKTFLKWTLGSGVFRLEIPRSVYERWPYRSVIAELVHVRSGTVLARNKISYYDLISEIATIVNYPVDQPIVGGMSSQMTDRGLGQLNFPFQEDLVGMERPYLSMLPYPDLPSFNNSLSNRARNIARYDDDSDKLNACIKLTDLDESRFSNVLTFPAYAEAFTEATLQYETVRNADNICPALGNPAAIAACYLAAQQACVQAPPQAGDFELCVDQIEGDVQSLTINRVDDLHLSFLESSDQESARVKSHIVIDGIDGRINGYLRSLSVQWRDSFCVGRPKASLNDQTIIDTDWINDWATCPDMQLDFSQGTTITNDKHGTYKILPETNNAQGIVAKQESKGKFTLTGETRNTLVATCAQSFINPAADDMVHSFANDLAAKLTDTWYANAPDSQEATVLSKLITPYRLAEITLPDHDLHAPFLAINSNPFEGMWLHWLTLVQSDINALSPYRIPQHFFSLNLGTGFTETALDPDGDPFDTSFTVTTGYLNQILNARAPSEILYFQFQPTWSDLEPFGVVTPPNQNADDPARLTGQVLSQFDPAFASIGNRELEIFVKPTFDPIVFMPNDISVPMSATGMPVSYGIDSLLIEFKSKSKSKSIGAGQKQKRWLALHLSFRDEDFRLSIDQAAGALFLAPVLRNDEYHSLVVDSRLKGCLMSTVGSAAHQFSCEGQLASKISRLLKPELRTRFSEMLSQIPAPQYFDAQGEAPSPVSFVQKSRWQQNQNITLFGNFE